MIQEDVLLDRIRSMDEPGTLEEMAIKRGIGAAMEDKGRRQNPYDPRKQGKLRDLWEWSRKKELRRLRKMRSR